MPEVEISTSAGIANLHYTISTPTDKSADFIDKTLPTVIFLHPVYFAQEIFHYQFQDHQLRKFNLVALDFRCHGKTSGKINPEYGPAEAAEDVSKFMDALGLPACHFFGVSMGSSAAFELAIAHPTKVLSLFLVSPLPEIESTNTAEVRKDIFNLWSSGMLQIGETLIDETLIDDALRGMVELGFGEASSESIRRLKEHCRSQGMKNWTRELLKEFWTVSVEFFTNRKPYLDADLRKIKCPVRLVSCLKDLAYDPADVACLSKKLEEANINVRLITVEGAGHFGHFTHTEQINPLIHDLVLEENPKILSPPANVASPWAAIFSDTDDDDLCL